MERGWVWTLMGAHSELWPPRCFSRIPASSKDLLDSFLFSRRSCQISASVGTQNYVGSRILPALTCHNRISSGSHSDNGVPRSPMKASQGSYFPTDSPSSGVIVTGPQFSTCLPTCSCQEGEPPLKSHFPAHGDEGTWPSLERAPCGSLACCGQV